jgi:hypothetical protein
MVTVVIRVFFLLSFSLLLDPKEEGELFMYGLSPKHPKNVPLGAER